MPVLSRTMGSMGGGQPPAPQAQPQSIELLGANASYAQPQQPPPAQQGAAGAIPPPPGYAGATMGQPPGTGPTSAPMYEAGAEHPAEDFLEGVLTETMKTFRMPADMIGYKNQWADDKIADWEADSNQSKWGEYGGITGMAGSVLAPGMGVLKLAKMAKKAGGKNLKKAMKSVFDEMTEGSPGIGGRAPSGRRS